MLETALGIFTSGAFGGIVGLVGTWLKGYEETKKQVIDNAHAIEMRKLDIEEMKQEAALKLQQTQVEMAGKEAIAQTEGETAKDVAASQALAASYDNDKATYGIKWVDSIRGLMRPAITLYLLIIVSVITWDLYCLRTLDAVSPDKAWSLFDSVIKDIVFLAVTAVTWWFGSRSNQGRK